MSIINELTSTNAVAMAVATALENVIGNDVILGVGRPKLVRPATDNLPSGPLRVAFADSIEGVSGGVYLVVSDGLANQLERLAPDEEMLTALAPVMDAATQTIRSSGVDMAFDNFEEVESDDVLSGAPADQEFVIYTFIDGAERLAALVIAVGAEISSSSESVQLAPSAVNAGADSGTQPQRAQQRTATAHVASGSQDVSRHEFQPLGDSAISLIEPRALSLLHDVEMGVTAELGRKRMSVRDLLALTPGSVIELDRAAGSPVDVLVNGTLIARGEVVVIDEEFGIRVSEIVIGNEVTV